uniref:Uncharacterized protein n=1 Tax=Arundo donax TaxID=35708 RepID=A0A0A9E2N6_ARUDO
MTVIKEKFNSYAMSIEANMTNICCLQTIRPSVNILYGKQLHNIGDTMPLCKGKTTTQESRWNKYNKLRYVYAIKQDQ